MLSKEIMEIQFRLKMSQFPGTLWNPKGKPKSGWMPLGAWETYEAFQKRALSEYEQAKRKGEVAEFLGATEFIQKPKVCNDKSITAEMIFNAEQYPVERLIDFSGGKALAWCHPDKSPSLMWWKAGNKARCHVCSKSFNAIAILVERDGMDFKTAVRQLQ